MMRAAIKAGNSRNYFGVIFKIISEVFKELLGNLWSFSTTENTKTS